MNDGTLTGYLVKGGVACAEPLFPSARLLKRSALEAERAAEAAQRGIEEARAEAEAIVKQAHIDAERIRADARASAEAQRTEEIDRCLAGIARAGDDAARRGAESLAACVFPIAAAVLESELSVRPERFIALVSAAIRAARPDGAVRLELHPLDAAAVHPRLAHVGNAGSVELVEDPARARFSALLETGEGLFEGGLQARLRLLEEAARRAAAEGVTP